MSIFKSRPVAIATVSAIAVAPILFIGSHTLSWFVTASVFLVLLFTLGLWIFARQKTSWLTRHEVVFITILLTSITVCIISVRSLYYFHYRTEIPSELYDGEIECLAEGVVDQIVSGAGYSTCTLTLHSLDGKAVQGRAVLSCNEQVSLQVGDVIRANIIPQSPEEFYEQDSLYDAIADGIRICLLCESSQEIERLETDPAPMKYLFIKWRSNISARLLTLTGKERGGLAIALFLGDRNGLDAGISNNFRRTGTSHLLALSGMHVTVLMGIFAGLTTNIGIPKRGRLLLLTALALLYLGLTGLRLSAIRATGMLLLFYCAGFIGSRHDPLTTLGLIGWSILSVSPYSVVDCGFWMSFLAVLGLVTVLPIFNNWLTSSKIPYKLHTLLQGIAASLIAIISVSYCNWLFIGEISPIGILLTVVMVPILSLILTLIPAVLLLDILPFVSAIPLSLPLSLALDIMIDLAKYVSSLRNIVFSLQFPYAGLILSLMLGIILIMMILPYRHTRYLMIPPVLTACLLIAWSGIWTNLKFQDQIHLDYVVRNSGSVLVVSAQGGTALIDTSSGSFSMMRDAERALTAQGATEIEHLILTHFHRSYSYSVERLAKRRTIRYLWVPLPQNETDYLHLSALSDRISPLGTELRCYMPGEEIELFDEASFQILDTSYLARSSQPILTYTVQTSREKLTFTSPVVQECAYNSTFRCEYQETDILLLGNHGPNAKLQFQFPDTESDPYLILMDSSEQLLHLDLSVQSKAYRLPIVVDMERYSFKMMK